MNFEGKRGINIFLNQNYGSMEVEVFGTIQRGSPDNIYVLGYDGEKIIEQKVTAENEHTFKFIPLLRVNMFLFDSLLQAFTSFADQKGLPKPQEDHMKGKLEATEKHLEDMRKLSEKLVDSLIEKRR
jgi:uncharacterized protein YlbG (UPF0298 family)